MVAMEFEDLSLELQEKVRACMSSEELLALANEEGIELTEDQLERINGGWSVARRHHRPRVEDEDPEE